MVVGDMKRVAIVGEKPNKEGNLCLVVLFDQGNTQPIIAAAVDERGATSTVVWCSPAWEKGYTWEESELLCQIAPPTPSPSVSPIPNNTQLPNGTELPSSNGINSENQGMSAFPAPIPKSIP